MTMSQWDALSQDDRDWCVASLYTPPTCPVCGGEDPEDTCQSLKNQHAYEVEWVRCYKQRAVTTAAKRFEKDPHRDSLVPIVTLNEEKVKS